MAFALAMKSETDFPTNGSYFLLFTIVVTLFTLVYASLFLDFTLGKCNILIENESQLNLETNPVSNVFEKMKSLGQKFHNTWMLPLVQKNNTELTENLNHDSL
jgi:hypothetical protein